MKQGDAAWHLARNSCAVTWSRAGAALGVGYISRAAYMKLKLQLSPKIEANWRMMEGNRREPYAAELYFRLMTFAGHPVTLLTDAFTLLPQDHRMGGSIDRLVECDLTGERWVLEIKTCPGGEMRTVIPVTHILQMLCQAKTMGVEKAHYIAWSQCQGILMAELTWDPSLWDQTVFPHLQEFCEWHAREEIPPKMRNGEAQMLEEIIRRKTFIKEIDCMTRVRLLQEQQQINPHT